MMTIGDQSKKEGGAGKRLVGVVRTLAPLPGGTVGGIQREELGHVRRHTQSRRRSIELAGAKGKEENWQGLRLVNAATYRAPNQG